jgi:hypothetical protein
MSTQARGKGAVWSRGETKLTRGVCSEGDAQTRVQQGVERVESNDLQITFVRQCTMHFITTHR